MCHHVYQSRISITIYFVQAKLDQRVRIHKRIYKYNKYYNADDEIQVFTCDTDRFRR